MSASNESHTGGLLYFIPHWIFEDENICPTTKLVYALLAGLANGNGNKECFPTDQYIADRLKISRKHANNCIGELEKIGAISRRNTASPNAFKKRRYIKVNLESKKCLRCNPQVTNEDNPQVTPGSNPQVTQSNKAISNKESTLKGTKESAAKIARAPHVSVSSKNHEELVKDFGEDLVKEAYEVLSQWKEDTPKGKWKKHDHLAIRRWVIDAIKERRIKAKRIEKASKTPENRIKQVQGYIGSHPKKEVLRRAENKNLININKDSIEILGVRDGMGYIGFAYDNAEKMIDHWIRKLDH